MGRGLEEVGDIAGIGIDRRSTNGAEGRGRQCMSVNLRGQGCLSQ